eukprot:m.16674 g.16674  ORF g.16674 m.16674 type:complete len:445 (+) comp4656_c0_seq1:10-1344(+)
MFFLSRVTRVVSTRGWASIFNASRTASLVPAVVSAHQNENKKLAAFALVSSITAATAFYSFDVRCEEEEDEESIKENSFKTRTVANYENRLRDYSTPDKVFRYFASVKVDDVVYMTPADFIRAVTPGEIQPEGVGLDLFAKKPSSFGKVTNPSARLFSHDDTGKVTSRGENGLISYAEFLFLLTLLSAPPRQFDFAFKMFDVNGDGTVDLEEFSTVQSAVQKSTASGRRIHKKDKTSVSHADVSHSFVVQKLFGKDGKGTCTVDDFHAFLSEVQEDVLHIDFLRHSESENGQTITELALCKMLLRYARLKKSDQKAFIKRIKSNTPKNMVHFGEVSSLFQSLRSIDDLSLALSIYTRAGSGVTMDEFKRACAVSSGVDLSDNIISFVFHLFDADGDNSLSENEFLSVMRSAGSRGLSNSKDLPVGRGFAALVQCIKAQMSQSSQ